MPEADSNPKPSISEEPGESADAVRGKIVEILRTSPPGVMTQYIIHRVIGVDEGDKMRGVVAQALDAMRADGLIYNEGSDHESLKWFLSQDAECGAERPATSGDATLGTTGPH